MIWKQQGPTQFALKKKNILLATKPSIYSQPSFELKRCTVTNIQVNLNLSANCPYQTLLKVHDYKTTSCFVCTELIFTI